MVKHCLVLPFGPPWQEPAVCWAGGHLFHKRWQTSEPSLSPLSVSFGSIMLWESDCQTHRSC